MKRKFLKFLPSAGVCIALGALPAGARAQAQGSWTMKAPIPLARNEVTLAAVGGKVHVIGGGIDNVAGTYHHEYDPATDRWSGRAPLPYGLGWFVTEIAGQRVAWHYGFWTGNSSLVIVVPTRGLVFVALSNSDQLSAPFGLGSGELERSSMAQAFLNGFVRGTLGG